MSILLVSVFGWSTVSVLLVSMSILVMSTLGWVTVSTLYQ